MTTRPLLPLRSAPRRAVVDVLTRHLNAWGGKAYVLVLLVCGHRQHTRLNSKQPDPKTARCMACLEERAAAREARPSEARRERSAG